MKEPIKTLRIQQRTKEEKDLIQEFKGYCYLEGVDMRTMIFSMIEGFVRDRRGE